MKKKRLVGRCA